MYNGIIGGEGAFSRLRSTDGNASGETSELQSARCDPNCQRQSRRPSSSTTQMAVVFCETSKPTNVLMISSCSSDRNKYVRTVAPEDQIMRDRGYPMSIDLINKRTSPEQPTHNTIMSSLISTGRLISTTLLLSFARSTWFMVTCIANEEAIDRHRKTGLFSRVLCREQQLQLV